MTVLIRLVAFLISLPAAYTEFLYLVAILGTAFGYDFINGGRFSGAPPLQFSNKPLAITIASLFVMSLTVVLPLITITLAIFINKIFQKTFWVVFGVKIVLGSIFLTLVFQVVAPWYTSNNKNIEYLKDFVYFESTYATENYYKISGSFATLYNPPQSNNLDSIKLIFAYEGPEENDGKFGKYSIDEQRALKPLKCKSDQYIKCEKKKFDKYEGYYILFKDGRKATQIELNMNGTNVLFFSNSVSLEEATKIISSLQEVKDPSKDIHKSKELEENAIKSKEAEQNYKKSKQKMDAYRPSFIPPSIQILKPDDNSAVLDNLYTTNIFDVNYGKDLIIHEEPQKEVGNCKSAENRFAAGSVCEDTKVGADTAVYNYLPENQLGQSSIKKILKFNRGRTNINFTTQSTVIDREELFQIANSMTIVSK